MSEHCVERRVLAYTFCASDAPVESTDIYVCNCMYDSEEPTLRFKSFMNHTVKVGSLAEKYNAVRHESDTLGAGDIMDLN